MDMEKILNEFDDAYNRAFNAGDVKACAAFFTEDVMLLPPGEPMTRGRAAFETTYKSRIRENTGGTHTNELIDYGVHGDMAYQIGAYAIEGSEPQEKGKFVNILIRQADGSWKVKVSIFNSDM